MNPNQKISFEALFPIIKEELDNKRSFSFTAFGKSMHPTIRGGVHRVTLSPMDEMPKIGDILFYRRTNGMFVLHRLCKIESDGSYTFCGDNQYLLETNIKQNQLLAKMTKLEINGKDVTPSPLSQTLLTAILPFRRFYLHAVVYLKRKFKAFFT